MTNLQPLIRPLATFSPSAGSRISSSLAPLAGTAMMALLLIFVAPAAHACAVCFGAPNTPATHGMNNAIFFLLGVVGFVQIGFASLFYTLWRRAREMRRRREQLQLIDGGLR